MKYIIAIIFLCFSYIAVCQPGNAPGDPGGDPDQPVPITGIEILLAAGGLLGAKKIYDSKKSSNK